MAENRRDLLLQGNVRLALMTTVVVYPVPDFRVMRRRRPAASARSRCSSGRFWPGYSAVYEPRTNARPSRPWISGVCVILSHGCGRIPDDLAAADGAAFDGIKYAPSPTTCIIASRFGVGFNAFWLAARNRVAVGL